MFPRWASTIDLAMPTRVRRRRRPSAAMHRHFQRDAPLIRQRAEEIEQRVRCRRQIHDLLGPS